MITITSLAVYRAVVGAAYLILPACAVYIIGRAAKAGAGITTGAFLLAWFIGVPYFLDFAFLLKGFGPDVNLFFDLKLLLLGFPASLILVALTLYFSRPRGSWTELEFGSDTINNEYMNIINVRKLVALDMFLNGKWLILTEFVVTAFGSLALAYFAYAPTAGQILWTIWLSGIGVNYLPLAIYAVGFVARNNYQDVAKDVMPDSVNRRYNRQQFLLFVPFLVAILSVIQKLGGRLH
jgi:hypothetical protein